MNEHIKSNLDRTWDYCFVVTQANSGIGVLKYKLLFLYITTPKSHLSEIRIYHGWM